MLQGDMQFEDRDRVVGEFRRGETKILISTDVLSRGFDVSQVRCSPAAAAAVMDGTVVAAASSVWRRCGDYLAAGCSIVPNMQQPDVHTVPISECMQ